MALATGNPPRIAGGDHAEGRGHGLVVFAPVLLPSPLGPAWSSAMGGPPSRSLRRPRSAPFAGSGRGTGRGGGHLMSCLRGAILSDLGRAS